MTSIRWRMIGLLMIGTVLAYLTRSSLGVAAPTLIEDLHLTTEQYSWITGAFQFGLLLQPLCGYVLDALGLKFGLALFAAAWSIITMAHGFANGWLGFAGLRGLMGVAEGSAHPAGMKTVAEWFPAKERGIAGGLYNVGASLGSMLAPPLIAWATLFHGWRFAFVVAGALGAVWVVLWLLLYHPLREHRRVSNAERDYIHGGQEGYLASDDARPSILSLARQRNFWAIALPRFLADPTWGTLSFWVPLYLAQVRGFDLKQIALFAWLPFVAADMGSMFGPIVVLALQRRGVTLIDARRWAFTLGAVLMTSMIFVGSVHSPASAIALLCLGGFAHQTLSVTVITMASDVFKRNEVATVAGMAGTCGNAGLMIFSLLIGALVARVGYDPFFIALGTLDLFGAVLLWRLLKVRS